MTWVVPSAAAPFTSPVVAEAIALVFVVTDEPLSSPATTGSIKLYVATCPVAARERPLRESAQEPSAFPWVPLFILLMIDFLPETPRYTKFA